MKLRDYQETAVDNTISDLLDGKSALDVMPTGTGKTVVFGNIAKRWHDRTASRVLILAHREELIFQAASKVEQITGLHPDIEMGEQTATRTGLFSDVPYVVSSIQTQNAGRRCLCREQSDDTVGGLMTGCEQCLGGIVRRMQKFNPSEFGLVIIDEAHHATAESYKRVIDYYRRNPSVKIMGVTATPDRTDEAALGQIFDSVSFHYELTDAIRDGWLVPISQEFVQCEHLDFSRCRTTAGDLNGGDLDRILTEEAAIHEIVNPTIEIAGDRTVLFFAASVAHAELMSDVLNRHRLGSARCVSGETPTDTRRSILRQFARGEFQYLCGCGVFLEGFDEPRIQVVAMARPTKSRSLYAQAVGRGTRPVNPPMAATAEERRAEIAASSKPGVLVLDFVGNAGRHKLMSTADILGGRYDDDVVEKAAANARKQGGARDMQRELELAQEEIVNQKRKAIKADKAKFTRQAVNPFDVFDLVPQRVPGWHKNKTATERQAETLVKMGVDPKQVEGMNVGHASQLLGELIRRRRENLCSYKQAQLLRRYGVDASDVTFNKASEIITSIKENGWRVPAAVKY